MRRTASVTPLTMAAPMLLTLSTAASAPSAASLPARLAVPRTLELEESAAAAATRPAASMLRATGFCASSAAFWPASRSFFGTLLSFVFPADLLAPPEALGFDLAFDPPAPLDDFPPEAFAMLGLLTNCNSGVTDVRRRQGFPWLPCGRSAGAPV
jgi:hypothetical protein